MAEMVQDPVDITVITHAIAVKNALPYFEIAVRGWGAGADNGIGRFLRLPNVPLAGLAISPNSTVDSVMVLEDYSAYTGALSNYNSNDFSRDVDFTHSTDDPIPPSTAGTNSGQTFGGKLRSARSVVSVHHPLIASISKGTVIIARNSSRHNGHYFDDANGSSQTFADKPAPDPRVPYQQPILILRCYIRNPGPISYPSSRVPISYSRRGPAAVDGFAAHVQFGVPPTGLIGAFPIGGRKKVHVEMWALPDNATGANSGIIDVRASVLRGGEAKVSANANPDESSQFFEDDIMSATLTPSTAANKVRTTITDNTAEWLLFFVLQTQLATVQVVDFAIFARAED